MTGLEQDLLKAIDIIAGARVSEMAFDKTLTCKIVDNSRADKGEYTVTDGSTLFVAYSSDASYEKDDQVYVSVPNGDMSKQKMITGKYIESENSTYFTYISPMKTYIDITGNLVPNDKEFSTLANSVKDSHKKILLYNIPVQNGKMYDRLGLSADFRTWLSPFKTAYGSYGLELNITTNVPQTSTTENISKVFKYMLDSSEFYGNPYNFETYYTQEKVIDISSLGHITNISLYLYQAGDFKDEGLNPIPYQQETPSGILEDLANNIFVSGCKVSLGYDKSNFNQDTLLLYTLDGETYNDDATNNLAMNKRDKTLQLRWVHLVEVDSESNANNGVEVIEDESQIPQGAVIHWYHYRLYEGVTDPLAGAFWEEIFPLNDDTLFKIKVSPQFGVNQERYKVIVENPSREEIYLQKYPLDETLIAFPDGDPDYLNNELDALYKAWQDAIALGDGSDHQFEVDYLAALEAYDANRVDYESAVLTLYNEKPVADAATIALIQGLKITCDEEHYNGVYRLYGDTGDIKNSNEANIMRKLVATYTSLVTGESQLDTAEKIIWKIPLENTMIYPPENEKEYDLSVSGVSYREENGYAIITRDTSFPEDTSIGDYLDSKTEQTFRIKNYLVQTATNNIVYCEVVKNNITYEASFEMTFGPVGTSGTNYTFIIEPDSKTPALTYGQTMENSSTPMPMKIKAHLFDYENKEMKAEDGTVCNGYPITYSWYSKDEESNIVFCDEKGKAYDKYIQVPEGELYNPCITYFIKSGNAYSEVTVEDSNMEAFAETFKADPTKYYVYSNENNFGPVTGPIYIRLKNANSVPNYYILQASITNYDEQLDKDIKLVALLPIPVRSSTYYTSIEGTTKVMYDSLGVSPSYYKQAYKLFGGPGKRNINEISGVTWSCYYDDDAEDACAYYPTITPEGVLVPGNMFIQGLSKRIAVSGAAPNGGWWIQPIVVNQDSYGSAMLNSWDGNLTLDEENGTILSSMIGAGRKNSANQFEGVLMGNVSLAHSNIRDLGVYGFNQGIASFGLKVDGTAFFGKTGKGQILIDGNKGQIKSASYEKNKTGMNIDLDDGWIDIRGVKHINDTLFDENDPSFEDYEPSVGEGKNSQVKISCTNPYFIIKDDYGESLMHIGSVDDQYYLQSSGFKSSPYEEYDEDGNLCEYLGKGVHFNLNEGYLKAFDFGLKAIEPSGRYKGSKVEFNSNGQPYFGVHLEDSEREIISEIDDAGNVTYKTGQSIDLIKINRSDFIMTSHNWSPGKDGIKFDLTQGKLEAYNNFTLSATSTTGETKGAKLTLSNGSNNQPYLRIKHVNTTKNQNLTIVDITKNTFVLRSQNWNSSSGNENGVQFDLVKGKITAYNNFELSAFVKDSSSKYNGSGIRITNGGSSSFEIADVNANNFNGGSGLYKEDGSPAGSTYNPEINYYRHNSNALPYIKIQHVDTEKEQNETVLEISRSVYRLRSHNWNKDYQTIDKEGNPVTRKTGTEIDLVKGKITSYAFTLKGVYSASTNSSGYNSDYEGRILLINTSASKTPIQVGTKFYVHWNGAIESTAGSIGGWKIDDGNLWSGTTTSNGKPGDTSFRLSSGTFSRSINSTNRSNLKMAIGTKFAVDSNGNLYCDDAIMDNIKVNNATLKGTITGVGWDVTAGGQANFSNIHATGGDVGGWTIGNGTLTNGTTVLSSSGLSFGSNHLTSSELVFGSVKLDSSGLTAGDIKLNSSGIEFGGTSITPSGGGGIFVSGRVDASGYLKGANITTPGHVKADGYIETGGTLKAAGATTLSSTLSVSGATTLSSTLTVSGATTLPSNTKIGGKSLGKLAFVDDVTKK